MKLNKMGCNKQIDYPYAKRRQHNLKIELNIVSIAIGLCISTASLAQNEQGEFIGTIELGESKRAVNTDTATPVTTIGQEEIKDRQATTIAELIDSVPGVTLVNGSTPSGSGINVRGFGANSVFGTDQKVLVVVDGATTGAEEIYRVGTQLFTDPYLFKSIDVNRGTVGSFEYGSGVVGGLIRLETKDASDFTGGETGFGGSLTAGYLSNGSGLNGSANLAFVNPNSEFLINVTYREQDAQEDGDGVEIGNSEFELPSFLLKSKFLLSDSQSLVLSYTDTSAQERDVFYDTFLTSDDTFGRVDRDIDAQTASFRYNLNPKNNDALNLDVDLTFARQEIDQEYLAGTSECEGGFPAAGPCGFPFPPGGFDVVNQDHVYETTKLTIKNNAFLTTGSLVHDLRTGIEFIRKERDGSVEGSAPGGEDDRIALFIVDDIEVTDKLTVSPSIRYEDQSIEANENAREFFNSDLSFDNDAFMGGISARYDFSSGFSPFISYARTESLPIIDDFDNTGDSLEIIEQFLQQPEVGTTAEVGFAFDKVGLFGNDSRFALKVNYYDTELEDVTSYSSVERVEIDGVELEASLALKNGFYIDLNANTSSGDEFRTSGNVVDWRNTPADSLRMTLGQKFGKFADVSLETIGINSETRTSESQGIIETDETSGAALFNLRATLKPKFLKNTDIRIGVENIGDKQYTPLLATRPIPGRNFKFTLTHNF